MSASKELFSPVGLPMAAVGLSRLGFLGVCLVCAILPNENNEYFSVSIDN